MREVTVEEIFSILYTEHNDSVKDGVYKQESLYTRNKQANVILPPFPFMYTKVDKYRNYGA